MPGVPGSGGPPPKRESQRRRANKPAGGEAEQAPAGVGVEIPDADSSWHPIAQRWFDALKVSGQSAFYEASDWLTAYALAESMSREFSPQPLKVGDEIEMVSLPPKAASLAAWFKGMAGLMVLEGDRRRLRLELEKPVEKGETNGVTFLDSARRRSG